MRAEFHTLPGSKDKATEDWVGITPELAVVLDGGTARTETGCEHGVSWYAHQLGAAIVAQAVDPVSLADCLARAISYVTDLHPQCDHAHPGTPSAAAGIVRLTPTQVEYLVLGDITVVLQTAKGLTVVADDRVSHTAQPARQRAARLPIGSPEKAEALLEMKSGELAARNTPGGYWVAATDPRAVVEAKTGMVPLDQVRAAAVLSDGAARAVCDFNLMDWDSAVQLLGEIGPTELIHRVRNAEAGDPLGIRWPRNKASDDATAVYLDLHQLSTPSPSKESS